jgi:hypothetical protein
MANVLDSLKSQIAKAKQEYRDRKKAIEHQIAGLERELAQLEAEYSAIGAIDGRSRRGRGRPGRGRVASKLGYGGVRAAVLGAIKGSKGIKPKDIIAKTGLSGAQVHNSLSGLKKTKEVRLRDGLYTVG